MKQHRRADADRVAAYGGHDGLGEIAQASEEPNDRKILERRSGHRRHHEVLQVVSGGEVGAAANDDRANGVVFREPLQSVGHIGVHAGRKRVLLLGSIDLNVPDAALGANDNSLCHVHLQKAALFDGLRVTPYGRRNQAHEL